MRSRFIEMFEKEKYPVVNLEELIDKNIETAKKDFSKESIIKYIDISSIDNVNHRIIGYNEFVLSDAPSRAQQHIRFNDILVSTVRPNLKNVARVELKDSNLVVSSGFCVLRPKKCSSEYLLSIVKSDKFTLDMSQAVSGATYPAIKDSDIYNYKIKYPPKEIQNAFSLFVKQLDKSKFLLQQMIEKLELLKKSRFIEMFGNPIVNEKKWKVVLLDDACEGIGDGLHGTPKYDDLGDYPFINGNNLIDGVIKITTSTRMVNEETYKKHYTNINNNAILISINGTLGKLAFYNGEKLMLGKSACYCNLKSNINRDFVYSVMKTEAFAGYLDSNSTSSTIKNIGLKAMRAFRLIQPPSKMQIEYVDFAKQIDKSKFWTEYYELLEHCLGSLEQVKSKGWSRTEPAPIF